MTGPLLCALEALLSLAILCLVLYALWWAGDYCGFGYFSGPALRR